MLCCQERCSDAEEKLLKRAFAAECLERWLAWSPRLRRFKECSDRWPCLRRSVIIVYCSKGFLICMALMLYGSLHTHYPSEIVSNETSLSSSSSAPDPYVASAQMTAGSSPMLVKARITSRPKRGRPSGVEVTNSQSRHASHWNSSPRNATRHKHGQPERHGLLEDAPHQTHVPQHKARSQGHTSDGEIRTSPRRRR